MRARFPDESKLTVSPGKLARLDIVLIASQLAAERAQLNRYVAALHAPRAGGRSIFQARGEMLKGRDTARAIGDEGARVLAALPKNARVVALDGRGRMHSSEQLAARMEHWRGQGRDLAFLVGGPEGHAPEVLARVDERWSLGPLTLPHMLVRLIVAEQLYRAASILANHPYHRG